MYFLALISISFTIFLETIQQLAFKQGARVRSQRLLFTLIGASLHVPHLLSWFFVLTLVPLSIGAPLLGASYMTVPIASRFVFKERISKRRALGVLFIVIGMAIISREVPR